MPKKGHVCPYQQKFKRRDQVAEGPTGFVCVFFHVFSLTQEFMTLTVAAVSQDSECQAEMDFELTVRYLGPLEKQGLPESYEPVNLPTIISTLNESFRHIAVDS